VSATRDGDGDREDLARLRAEWLRFRANLFDPESGLPTLSSALDGLRRQLEEGHALAVFALSLGAGKQTEELWGWQTYDQTVRDLVGEIKANRGQGAVPDGLLCLPAIRSDEAFLFVTASNGSGVAMSAEELAEKARRLDAYIGERLVARSHRPETGRRFVGASMLYFDPKVRVERMIYRAIREARTHVDEQNADVDSERGDLLRGIIADGAITPVFQPIWDLANQRIVAVEALSRGPGGSGFDDGESLFSFAERAELLLPLERVCRRRILEEARQLPAGTLLFINLSPAAASDEDFLGHVFEDLVRKMGFEPSRVVLEITERTCALQKDLFERILRELRREGFLLAVDDIGTGYASFSSLAEIAPDYLKFDSVFVHGIHRHQIKRDLLDAMLSFARKSETRVIAEGIETPEELATLQELGVPLGQGYLLARPAPVADVRALLEV
jgi:EAL domain-containing protein (putative c-di-GMP-specific phosphodiesterase class I)